MLLGKGDGTFTRTDLAAAGQNPRGITTADINNDGKPDLIYSGYATGVVQVLTGNGSGRFSKGATYMSPALHPQGVATADFDHDGRLDVAVAYASATGLRILYGNGGTSFAARTIAGDANLNVLDVGDSMGTAWLDVAAAPRRAASVAILSRRPTRPRPRADGNRRRLAARARGRRSERHGIPDIVTANRASSTVATLGDRAHQGRVPRTCRRPPRDLAAATPSSPISMRTDMSTSRQATRTRHR